MNEIIQQSAYSCSVDNVLSKYFKHYNKWQLDSSPEKIQDYYINKLAKEKLDNEKSISPFLFFSRELWDFEKTCLKVRQSLVFPKSSVWSKITTKEYTKLLQNSDNKILKIFSKINCNSQKLSVLCNESEYTNIGQNIVHVAWRPCLSSESQILACLVALDNLLKNNEVNVLQIWDYGTLNNNSSKPVLKYSQILDLGNIIKMLWISPDQVTGCQYDGMQFELPQSLYGHMLFVCANGKLKIIPIAEFLDSELNSMNLSPPDPNQLDVLQIASTNVMELGISTSHVNDTKARFGCPTCVDWKSKFPTKILVGYSKGYVAIFDLSIAHHTRYNYVNHYLSPIYKKRLSHSAIICVAISPVDWQQFNVTVAPNPEGSTNFNVNISSNFKPIDVIKSDKPLWGVIWPSRADVLIAVPISRNKVIIKSILSQDTVTVQVNKITSICACDLFNSIIVTTECGSLVSISLNEPSVIKSLIGLDDSIDSAEGLTHIRSYRYFIDKNNNNNKSFIDIKCKADLVSLYDSHDKIEYPQISSVSVNPNLASLGWVAVGFENGIIHTTRSSNRDTMPLIKSIINFNEESNACLNTPLLKTKKFPNVRRISRVTNSDKKKPKSKSENKTKYSPDYDPLDNILYPNQNQFKSSKLSQDSPKDISNKNRKNQVSKENFKKSHRKPSKSSVKRVYDSDEISSRNSPIYDFATYCDLICKGTNAVHVDKESVNPESGNTSSTENMVDESCFLDSENCNDTSSSPKIPVDQTNNQESSNEEPGSVKPDENQLDLSQNTIISPSLQPSQINFLETIPREFSNLEIASTTDVQDHSDLTTGISHIETNEKSSAIMKIYGCEMPPEQTIDSTITKSLLVNVKIDPCEVVQSISIEQEVPNESIVDDNKSEQPCEPVTLGTLNDTVTAVDESYTVVDHFVSGEFAEINPFIEITLGSANYEDIMVNMDRICDTEEFTVVDEIVMVDEADHAMGNEKSGAILIDENNIDLKTEEEIGFPQIVLGNEANCSKDEKLESLKLEKSGAILIGENNIDLKTEEEIGFPQIVLGNGANRSNDIDFQSLEFKESSAILIGGNNIELKTQEENEFPQIVLVNEANCSNDIDFQSLEFKESNSILIGGNNIELKTQEEIGYHQIVLGNEVDFSKVGDFQSLEYKESSAILIGENNIDLATQEKIGDSEIVIEKEAICSNDEILQSLKLEEFSAILIGENNIDLKTEEEIGEPQIISEKEAPCLKSEDSVKIFNNENFIDLNTHEKTEDSQIVEATNGNYLNSVKGQSLESEESSEKNIDLELQKMSVDFLNCSNDENLQSLKSEEPGEIFNEENYIDLKTQEKIEVTPIFTITEINRSTDENFQFLRSEESSEILKEENYIDLKTQEMTRDPQIAIVNEINCSNDEKIQYLRSEESSAILIGENDIDVKSHESINDSQSVIGNEVNCSNDGNIQSLKSGELLIGENYIDLQTHEKIGDSRIVAGNEANCLTDGNFQSIEYEKSSEILINESNIDLKAQEEIVMGNTEYYTNFEVFHLAKSEIPSEILNCENNTNLRTQGHFVDSTIYSLEKETQKENTNSETSIEKLVSFAESISVEKTISCSIDIKSVAACFDLSKEVEFIRQSSNISSHEMEIDSADIDAPISLGLDDESGLSVVSDIQSSSLIESKDKIQIIFDESDLNVEYDFRIFENDSTNSQLSNTPEVEIALPNEATAITIMRQNSESLINVLDKFSEIDNSEKDSAQSGNYSKINSAADIITSGFETISKEEIDIHESSMVQNECTNHIKTQQPIDIKSLELESNIGNLSPNKSLSLSQSNWKFEIEFADDLQLNDSISDQIHSTSIEQKLINTQSIWNTDSRLEESELNNTDLSGDEITMTSIDYGNVFMSNPGINEGNKIELKPITIPKLPTVESITMESESNEISTTNDKNTGTLFRNLELNTTRTFSTNFQDVIRQFVSETEVKGTAIDVDEVNPKRKSTGNIFQILSELQIKSPIPAKKTKITKESNLQSRFISDEISANLPMKTDKYFGDSRKLLPVSLPIITVESQIDDNNSLNYQENNELNSKVSLESETRNHDCNNTSEIEDIYIREIKGSKNSEMTDSNTHEIEYGNNISLESENNTPVTKTSIIYEVTSSNICEIDNINASEIENINTNSENAIDSSGENNCNIFEIKDDNTCDIKECNASERDDSNICEIENSNTYEIKNGNSFEVTNPIVCEIMESNACEKENKNASQIENGKTSSGDTFGEKDNDACKMKDNNVIRMKTSKASEIENCKVSGMKEIYSSESTERKPSLIANSEPTDSSTIEIEGTNTNEIKDINTSEVENTKASEMIDSNTSEMIDSNTSEMIDSNTSERKDINTSEIEKKSKHIEMMDNNTSEVENTKASEMIDSNTSERKDINTSEIEKKSKHIEMMDNNTSEVENTKASEMIDSNTSEMIDSNTSERKDINTSEIEKKSKHIEMMDNNTSEVENTKASEMIDSNTSERKDINTSEIEKKSKHIEMMDNNTSEVENTKASEMIDSNTSERKDINTSEIEKSKHIEMKDINTSEVENTKASEMIDSNTSERKDINTSEIENTKASEIEGTNTCEIKNIKACSIEHSKASEIKDRKGSLIEDIKAIKRKDINTSEIEDRKVNEINDSKAIDIEDKTTSKLKDNKHMSSLKRKSFLKTANDYKELKGDFKVMRDTSTQEIKDVKYISEIEKSDIYENVGLINIDKSNFDNKPKNEKKIVGNFSLDKNSSIKNEIKEIQKPIQLVKLDSVIKSPNKDKADLPNSSDRLKKNKDSDKRLDESKPSSKREIQNKIVRKENSKQTKKIPTELTIKEKSNIEEILVKSNEKKESNKPNDKKRKLDEISFEVKLKKPKCDNYYRSEKNSIQENIPFKITRSRLAMTNSDNCDLDKSNVNVQSLKISRLPIPSRKLRTINEYKKDSAKLQNIECPLAGPVVVKSIRKLDTSDSEYQNPKKMKVVESDGNEIIRKSARLSKRETISDVNTENKIESKNLKSDSLSVQSVSTSTNSDGSSSKRKRSLSKSKKANQENWWNNSIITIEWQDDKYIGGRQRIKGFLLDDEPVVDKVTLVHWPKITSKIYPAIVREIFFEE